MRQAPSTVLIRSAMRIKVKKMDEIKKRLKELLKSKDLNLVIGYGQREITLSDGSEVSTIIPVFLTEEQEIDHLVWNRHCLQNLVQYLTKGEYKVSFEAIRQGKKKRMALCIRQASKRV